MAARLVGASSSFNTYPSEMIMLELVVVEILNGQEPHIKSAVKEHILLCLHPVGIANRRVFVNKQR
jgi:hypothetical protein